MPVTTPSDAMHAAVVDVDSPLAAHMAVDDLDEVRGRVDQKLPSHHACCVAEAGVRFERQAPAQVQPVAATDRVACEGPRSKGRHPRRAFRLRCLLVIGESNDLVKPPSSPSRRHKQWYRHRTRAQGASYATHVSRFHEVQSGPFHLNLEP